MDSVNLMLVDDDESFHYLMLRLIKKMNNPINCISVKNGEEAIDYIKTSLQKKKNPLPDLLFVDINMPVMNGFEFIKKFGVLKEQYQELNNIQFIAILSSSDIEKDKKNADNLGHVDEYIVKPNDYKQMTDIITSIIDKYIQNKTTHKASS